MKDLLKKRIVELIEKMGTYQLKDQEIASRVLLNLIGSYEHLGAIRGLRDEK